MIMKTKLESFCPSNAASCCMPSSSVISSLPLRILTDRGKKKCLLPFGRLARSIKPRIGRLPWASQGGNNLSGGKLGKRFGEGHGRRIGRKNKSAMQKKIACQVSTMQTISTHVHHEPTHRPRDRTETPIRPYDPPRNRKDDGNHRQHHNQTDMLGIPPNLLSRHGYLPTDNVGRLYCWPCWDRLEKESPRLAGHHDDEVCDHCEETIKPDRTPIWKIKRQK